MSTISKRDRLVKRLQDKERREAYVAAQIGTGVSFQIRANRKARKLTQDELSAQTGIWQSMISRLEGPDHDSLPNLETLKKLADSFGCALIVRFAPFSELVDWTLGIPGRELAVPSFSDDPGLLGKENERLTSSGNVLKLVTTDIRTELITTDTRTAQDRLARVSKIDNSEFQVAGNS